MTTKHLDCLKKDEQQIRDLLAGGAIQAGRLAGITVIELNGFIPTTDNPDHPDRRRRNKPKPPTQ